LLARSERQPAIKQGRTNSQRLLPGDCRNLWLANTIPIFERGFEVALDKVDGSEEVIGIGIGRIEVQSAPQPSRRVSVPLLLECDSRQFDGESLVARSESPAIEQSAS